MSEPIQARDASQIAAGGCIIGVPIVLAGIFRWALKAAESKEHVLAHQIEEVEIEHRGGEGSGANLVPAEESLARFLTSLRRVTAPFEKMGARFERANYDSELKKLENLKKRFQSEGKPPSSESQMLILEAEQTLARYAPPN